MVGRRKARKCEGVGEAEGDAALSGGMPITPTSSSRPDSTDDMQHRLPDEPRGGRKAGEGCAPSDEPTSKMGGAHGEIE
eukprot:evm.model.scf_510.7 EVM.evm.TU.scf_510.7   scf_510:10750-10984(+)